MVLQLHDQYTLSKAFLNEIDQQVALDNLAIATVEADLKIYNETEKLNQLLRQLDQVHHFVHLCRWVSKECLLKDKLLEQKMDQIAHLGLRILNAKWQINSTLIIKKRAQYPRFLIKHRPSQFEVQRLPCPNCQLKRRLRMPFYRLHLEDFKGGLAPMNLVAQKQNELWKYAYEK